MNLNTFQISQCIANKDYSTAEQAITDFIRSNMHVNDILDIPIKGSPLGGEAVDQEQIHYTFCEQIVTLITQLFSAPRYKPSITTINTFFTCKFIVEWLFSASLWKNTDALIEHLQLIQTDRFGNLKLNEKRLTLLLMLITLSSKFQLPWKTLFKAMPSQALSAYIGLVTQPVPAISKESNAGFNYSLESAKDLPLFDLPVVEDLGKLNYPFFACSYATSPNKYEFKKWLTKLIRHNLSQWLSPKVKKYIDGISSAQQKPRLKVAVMLELYSTNHAMYRCYNSTMVSLSKEFDLIAFIDESDVSNADLSSFQKVCTFKNVFDVNANAELIIDEAPDIIYYPSIGLKFWGIYLSQLRLAPKQLMSCGHPSSSFSPEIDYCLMSGSSISSEDIQPFFSEKVIIEKEEGYDSSVHTLHNELSPGFISSHNKYLADGDDIIIGVNGVITKVTYSTIEVCKQIQDKSSKKITFLFFCGNSKKTISYLSTKKQLSRMLKYFELEEYSDYLTYMKKISTCHFLLPTLPFGGANSNIDAMVLNKPKLFIKGTTQLYTRCDRIEWDRVGLGGEFGCDTTKDLIDKSVHLIENDNHRKEIYAAMVKKCDINRFFDNNNDKDNEYNIHHSFSKVIEDVIMSN